MKVVGSLDTGLQGSFNLEIIIKGCSDSNIVYTGGSITD